MKFSLKRKNKESIETTSERKTRKKNKKAKKIIALLLIVAILGTGVFFYFNKNNKKADVTVSTARVIRGNIRVSVSGSGTLEAIESYEVKSKVSGDVLSSPFNEGDKVEKDQVLYTIDTTDIQNTIERAELSMEKTRDSYNTTMENIEKLTVKAPINGTITEMYVAKGDSVNSGTKICDITDNSKMTLTVPFNSVDAASVYNGASARVVLDNSFFETTGVVTRVATGSVSTDTYASITYVDISVDNPGGIKEGDTATAMVGEVACNSSGTFKNNGKKTVTAEVSGEVGTIYNNMGDYMYAGGVILALESDNVETTVKNAKNSLRDAELSLENTYDKLDDYTIKAPISGTVIYKNIKAGDTLDNTTGAASLCYIADLSSIVFTLSVDELDINKIKTGQNVEITADAVAGMYTGKVSKVSINGSTANGVTTYPVEITLDDPGELIPGMNVNADIIIEEKANTLMVPVSAIVRGGLCYVKDDGTQKKASAKAGKPATENAGKNMPAGNFTPGEGKIEGNGAVKPDGSQAVKPDGEKFARPEGTKTTKPEGGPSTKSEGAQSTKPAGAETKKEDVKSPEKTQNTPAKNASGNGNTKAPAFGNMAPEGFVAVRVETGVNNDDYIEVLSGLKEGDEVYVKSVSATTNMGFPGMGGMPMGGGMGGMSGGMRSGGGMPSGMSGGMRSGGMSGGMSGGGMRSGGSFGGGMR